MVCACGDKDTGYFKEKSFRGLAEELSMKIRGVEMSREAIELEDTREEEDVCASVQLKNWDMFFSSVVRRGDR